MKINRFFLSLVFILCIGELLAQQPVHRHEFRAGINRAFLTTGDQRTPCVYNQYLFGLSPRWSLMATASFLHASSFPETNLIDQPAFPPAFFVNTDYNVSDLETNLDHQTITWIEVAPQYRAIIGERHQFGISIGPSIGYFHYSTIASLEIGTFISPIRTADITLVEYIHTRGIDIGGHGRLAYDFFAGQYLSLGAQASAHIFANGDFIYNLGINAGIRL